jgi:hypothetical protein
MPPAPRRFPRPLLVALLLVGVAGVAAVVLRMTADPPGPWVALAHANPDLKVAASVMGE